MLRVLDVHPDHVKAFKNLMELFPKENKGYRLKYIAALCKGKEYATAEKRILEIPSYDQDVELLKLLIEARQKQETKCGDVILSLASLYVEKKKFAEAEKFLIELDDENHSLKSLDLLVACFRKTGKNIVPRKFVVMRSFFCLKHGKYNEAMRSLRKQSYFIEEAQKLKKKLADLQQFAAASKVTYETLLFFSYLFF